jgi:diguanylate cyclase (GGDEF)-like protein/PAS domain S-box-containing protein
MQNHMNLKVSPWQSLKTRLTLFTLAIFLVGIWAHSFYAARLLKEDMGRVLGEQQFQTVSLVASQINEDLQVRQEWLGQIAQKIDASMVSKPAALQAYLEQRTVLLQMFNGGVFATGADGTAVADVPRENGRIGTNYLDRESVSIPLKEGKTLIGRPAMGKKLGAPVFSIVTPLRDGAGAVIGTLVGTINLGKPNFLDKITQSHYGKTGGYLLIAPQHQLIVTASDKSRIMQPAPPPGMNTMHDRYMQGYDGFGVAVSSRGVEELSAAKGVPVAGWFLAVAIPTAEAFAPVVALQQSMGLATLMLTLLTGALTWRVLKHQLAPLVATADAMAALADSRQIPQPLADTHQGEIGLLVAGFNRILEKSVRREESLKASESFKDVVLNTLDAEIAVVDRNGVIQAVNTRWQQFAVANSLEPGEPAQHTGVGTNYLAVCGVGTDAGAGLQAVVDGRLPSFRCEYPCDTPTQRHWFSMIAMPLGEVGKGGAVITHTDITERKREEEKIRLSASVFSHAREGITITDAQGTIIDVNEAFTRITGYLREEVIGQNPRILKSGRQDRAFYEAMWRDLTGPGHWSNEIWNRRKNGEVYAQLLTISAVRDAAGVTQNYVALFSDITGIKEQQYQLEHIAHFDALTNLPNRRMLEDRLNQAMATSKRNGLYGALMFLDLDNFKPLNDTHGHGVGDLLLIEVARRLSACVREVDTVARTGGDEFVVVLSELDADKTKSGEIAAGVAQKIRISLAVPYRLTVATPSYSTTTVEHHCSVSIGVVLFVNHESSQTDLMKWADAAMYQAKAAGRNVVRFYEQDMSVALVDIA